MMLLPREGNLLSGPEKDRLQQNIRKVAGDRWSEHTKKLEPLKVGDFVMCQNLRGPHPLKSDYSGEVVGLKNLNSYAVRIQPGGQVSTRNRTSLRKISKPVTLDIPVVDVESDRPGRVTRSGKARTLVTEVPGARAELSGIPRQSLGPGQGQGSGIPRQSLGPGQGQGSGGGLMRQLPGQTTQEFYDGVCEEFMGQIFPLGKSPVTGQGSKSDDSGPRTQGAGGRELPGVGLPGQRVSPGGPSAGTGRTPGGSGRDLAGSGGTSGLSDRLASQELLESNVLSVQGPQCGSQSSRAAAGPSLGGEVAGMIRKSGRQRFKPSIYQAGQGGMEGSSSC